MASSAPSLSDLDHRLRAIPGLLGEQLKVEGPNAAGLARIEHWDVVGVGASDGPARLLASVLPTLGISACAHSISHFFGSSPLPDVPRSRQRGLVIFSQGLSPNAQLALQAAPHYAYSLLFTSVTAEARPERARLLDAFPGELWYHGPREESGTLVRFAGPMVASLAALRFAHALAQERGTEAVWAASLSTIPEAYGAASTEANAWGSDPAACLAIATDLTIAGALMWKWQEALYARLPPSFDVLSFAHGPLQAFYEQPAFFVALERSTPAHGELWSRFRRVLHPERHRVTSLRATLPGPLALFEFDAALCTKLLAEMRKRGIDPAHWPGQSSDGPLYSVSPPQPHQGQD